MCYHRNKRVLTKTCKRNILVFDKKEKHFKTIKRQAKQYLNNDTNWLCFISQLIFDREKHISMIIKS